MLPDSRFGKMKTFACPATALPGALSFPTVSSIAASTWSSPSIGTSGSACCASIAARATFWLRSCGPLPLVEKLKKYESYHCYEPEDPQLYAKVFEYATNSARQLLKDVDQAVKNRGNTVKDLEKQVGKDDKVKTKAYANRLESAHKEVARLMDESRAVWRLLLSFNFEFEQGRLAEKKYDESKRLQSKIDEQTKRRWLPKEALSLYERASGESSVSLVMQ